MSDKFKEAKYDERQTAVRGRAFKYAYGTLLVALLFYAASDDIWNWCVPLTGCAVAIAVSLVPYAWVSIMNEAYWWANTQTCRPVCHLRAAGPNEPGLGAELLAQGRFDSGRRAPGRRSEHGTGRTVRLCVHSLARAAREDAQGG